MIPFYIVLVALAVIIGVLFWSMGFYDWIWGWYQYWRFCRDIKPGPEPIDPYRNMTDEYNRATGAQETDISGTWRSFGTVTLYPAHYWQHSATQPDNVIDIDFGTKPGGIE